MVMDIAEGLWVVWVQVYRRSAAIAPDIARHWSFFSC